MGKVPTTPEDFAKLQAAEQRRVRDILRRDKEEYGREIARAAAEIEFEKGKKVSIVDIAIEPTEEWKAKGPYRTFTPRLEDGTVKTVKAHRRELTPVTRQLWAAGRLSDDQHAACYWYRVKWEEAGLVGRVKTNHLSLTGNVGGGGGSGQSPIALHESEAIAREEFRAARDAISDHLLRMFDAVVLRNLSLRRAARFVRCRNDNALPQLRSACQQLVVHCEAMKHQWIDPTKDLD